MSGFGIIFRTFGSCFSSADRRFLCAVLLLFSLFLLAFFIVFCLDLFFPHLPLLPLFLLSFRYLEVQIASFKLHYFIREVNLLVLRRIKYRKVYLHVIICNCHLALSHDTLVVGFYKIKYTCFFTQDGSYISRKYFFLFTK